MVPFVFWAAIPGVVISQTRISFQFFADAKSARSRECLASYINAYGEREVTRASYPSGAWALVCSFP